jgi:hypothetical protein
MGWCVLEATRVEYRVEFTVNAQRIQRKAAQQRDEGALAGPVGGWQGGNARGQRLGQSRQGHGLVGVIHHRPDQRFCLHQHAVLARRGRRRNQLFLVEAQCLVNEGLGVDDEVRAGIVGRRGRSRGEHGRAPVLATQLAQHGVKSASAEKTMNSS